MSIINKLKAVADIIAPPVGYKTLFIRSDTGVPALMDSDGNVANLSLGGDASGVTYTPLDVLDWTDSVDPGNVAEALDDLALRTHALENSDATPPDASGVTYEPQTPLHWTDSEDPGNVDDALDDLAARVNSLEESDGGVIDIAGGGTGATAATEAFDNLSPATTAGDLIYSDGTNNVRLPIGTAGQTLVVNAGATAPEWGSGSGGVTDGDKGDVTVSSSGTVWTIDNDAVTYAKMQDVSATSRILGRKTASAGDPEECTLSEVLDFVGSAAQGDILYRGAAAWARLAAGTAGGFLRTAGGSANPAWARLNVGLDTAFNASTFTTSSTTYVDLLDATAGATIGFTFTKAFAGTTIYVFGFCASSQTSANGTVTLGVNDGTTDWDICRWRQATTVSSAASGVAALTGLSAGSVALKLRIKTDAGTFNLGNSGSAVIFAIEI